MKEIHKKEHAMDEAFAWEQIDRATYGVLGVMTTEGLPYAVPVSTAREGNCIYFHSALVGVKSESLRVNPKVTMVFVSEQALDPMHFTHRYKSAMIEGIAEEVTDNAEKIRIMRDVIVQKLAPSNPMAKTRDYDHCIIPTAIWKINITGITGKAHLPMPD